MVLDTSAIVAVIFDEPEREAFLSLIARNPTLSVSALTFYETSIVAFGKKPDPLTTQSIESFLDEFSVEVVSADADAARAARDAYFRFGKGYHPASLNLADCFSYSLAKTRDEPLLFKGDDFSQTDIVPAWRP